jgi:hypothetical protein
MDFNINVSPKSDQSTEKSNGWETKCLLHGLNPKKTTAIDSILDQNMLRIIFHG